MQRHEIQDVWCRSWEQQNWVPVIHTKADAELHPLFKLYDKAIRRFPTVNHPDYELACWRRWLVADLVGGYWCDDDVVNVNLDAQTFAGSWENLERPCPSAWPINGQPNCGLMHIQRQSNMETFITCVLEGNVPIRQEPCHHDRRVFAKHSSDMFLWERLACLWPPRFMSPLNELVSYFHEQKTTPLVHCSSNSVRIAGVDKTAAMRLLLATS